MTQGQRTGLVVAVVLGLGAVLVWRLTMSSPAGRRASAAGSSAAGGSSAAPGRAPISGARPPSLAPGGAGSADRAAPSLQDLATALASMTAGGSATTGSPGVRRFDAGAAWGIPAAPYVAAGHAVNLAGGAATVTSPFPTPPAVDGPTIEVTRNGRPVAGAAVVVASRLSAVFGHLTGDWAGSTGADGKVRSGVAPSPGLMAVAIDPGGWSAVTPVGADGARLELLPPASLRVEVVEGGAAVEADLDLSSADGTFHAQASAATGVFAFALLPPGTYQVRAEVAAEFATGRDTQPPITVVVEAGRAAAARIDLPADLAMVAVQAEVPADTSMVAHALIAPPMPATDEELRGRTRDWMILGGDDATNVFQYHRVPAGPRLACVRLPQAAQFACVPVEVPASGVVEVTVPVGTAAP